MAQTRACLLVDPATRGLRPAVTAEGGRVTVAGMVDSEELRGKVIAMARAIPGVVDVIDEMVVVPITRGYAT